MADRRGLLRAELALAALGLTTTLVVVALAVDTLLYHLIELDPHLALGVLAAVVIARAGRSLVRQLRAQRAFLRRLPILRETILYGRRVRVIADPGLEAFCAGALRPAVYVSESALEGDDRVLRAVLAHEAHHARRRDPLRLLLARMLSDALRPLPPFAALAERQAALADLAADAATVDALGDRRPLAAALVRFDKSAGVAPERVDRLVGTARAVRIPSALLVATAAALAGIAATVLTMLVADWHPELALPIPLEIAALALACAPAWVAARRA